MFVHEITKIWNFRTLLKQKGFGVLKRNWENTFWEDVSERSNYATGPTGASINEKIVDGQVGN